MSTLLVKTQLGEFSLTLYDDRAPITCEYFRSLAQENAFENGTVFRIISKNNQQHNDLCPIHIVQIGTAHNFSAAKNSIAHEGTNQTLISHVKWTVSAARFGPGELYCSFFVCMRDEPELDFGGQRQSDGQGYAAFGKISDGFDTLETIFKLSETSEMLAKQIPVFRIQLEDV